VLQVDWFNIVIGQIVKTMSKLTSQVATTYPFGLLECEFDHYKSEF